MNQLKSLIGILSLGTLGLFGCGAQAEATSAEASTTAYSTARSAGRRAVRVAVALIRSSPAL